MSGASRKTPFSIYLITDRRLARSGLLATCDEALAVAQSRQMKVAVQLREKDLSARELYQLACSMRSLCTRRDALLLINDRIDIAIASGADGIHLPSDSFTVRDARKLLGPSRLIGVSTHNRAQLDAASEADFAVFGPVFDPVSKKAYGPATGTDALAEACASTSIPVYALGGITPARIPEIQNSGAAGVALIGAIFAVEQPADAMRELIEAMPRVPIVQN